MGFKKLANDAAFSCYMDWQQKVRAIDISEGSQGLRELDREIYLRLQANLDLK